MTAEAGTSQEKDVAMDVDGQGIETADEEGLPANRFELELEFVQSLASPAYLHFLSTYRDPEGTAASDSKDNGSSNTLLLQDPAFQSFLRYLYDTWSRPEYARFLTYPHCLYFLQLLINDGGNCHNNDKDNDDDDSEPTSSANNVVAKEWTLPAYRNFCHQQQFLAWQHRHATLYGKGLMTTAGEEQETPKDGTEAPAQTPADATSSAVP